MKNSTAQNKFSQLLTDYINESGYSVNRIAQITNLGRSAIQHTMSGKLMPAKAFVDKLASVLPITPSQREEFIELYLKEKVGETAYERRKYCTRIFSNLSCCKVSAEAPVYAVRSEISSEGISVVTGIANVNRVLLGIVAAEVGSERKKVLCALPFENSVFFNMVTQLTNTSDNPLHFEHFLRLFKSEETHTENNLFILENALQMSICNSMSYHPYYHYAYLNCLDDFLPAYPYGLVSSDSAALVSSDFSSAVVSSDKAFVNSVREHMLHVRSKSIPMIDSYDNQQGFELFMQSTRLLTTSMEYQPCLTQYLTKEMVTNRLADIPGRDAILEKVMSSFFTEEAMEVTNEQIITNYFSREGLENFTDTGIMANLPGGLLEPLSPEERIVILEKMKQNIDQYVMLDSRKFRISDFIQIMSLSNRSIIICCQIDNKKMYSIILEPGLCAALDDFMSSVTEMGWTHSEENGLRLIDSCISRLNDAVQR